MQDKYLPSSLASIGLLCMCGISYLTHIALQEKLPKTCTQLKIHCSERVSAFRHAYVGRLNKKPWGRKANCYWKARHKVQEAVNYKIYPAKLPGNCAERNGQNKLSLITLIHSSYTVLRTWGWPKRNWTDDIMMLKNSLMWKSTVSLRKVQRTRTNGKTQHVYFLHKKKEQEK